MVKKASQCAKKYYKKLEFLNLPPVYRTAWQPRKLPMTSRNLVIGAGMGTTGTHGLVVALEELGLHGYHYKDARASANEHAREHKLPEFLTEIVEGMLANTSQCHETIENFDFSQLPENVDYVSDTPFTESFLDVYFQFPEAKVVLTTRPSLEWAKSRRKHGNSPPPVMRPCGLQGLKEYSDEDLAAMLEAYHDLVRCVVPRKNLLELNLFEEGLNLTSSLTTFLEDRPGPLRPDTPTGALVITYACTVQVLTVWCNGPQNPAVIIKPPSRISPCDKPDSCLTRLQRLPLVQAGQPR